MEITIQILPGKFFFSGSISLSAGQTIIRDMNSLTDTELQDIIEGYDMKTLKVSGITAAREEYKKRTARQIINNTIIDNSELIPRVENLESEFHNLTLGVVKSEVFWSTTDW